MKTCPKGPKPFGGWVRLYEERDRSKFILDDREELMFDRDHGFFTWMVDFDHFCLAVPKMCGDGRYWRPIVLSMILQLRRMGFPCRGAYFVTKRRPEVYIRAIGGTLVKQKYDGDTVYSYILVSPENTKVKGGR